MGLIIVNTKNYKSGNELLKLAKLVEFYNSDVVLAVPATEIYRISQTKLRVYAQHIDFVIGEKSTGFISAEDVKKAGAIGVMLNHSEHFLDFSTLKNIVLQCRKVNLDVLICARHLGEANKLISLKPDYIALEDPSLIGSNKSITSLKPVEVLKFVNLFKDKSIIPVCGSGISSPEDVRAAYALGCKGVLISHAIAAEKSPRSFLLKLGAGKF